MQLIPNHIRKAAVLLRSLDSETSAQLLAQLSTEEVALVRTAVRSLNDAEVDDDERADVLAEFQMAGTEASHSESGVEIADSLLSLGRETEYSPSKHKFEQQNAPQAFSFLSEAAPRDLAPYLERQHAQTVAVILSHLDAERAASLLVELPNKLQADIIQRLSDLGSTDSESLQIIQDDLAAWLQHQEFGNTQVNRGDHAARILAATAPQIREGLISQVGQRNNQLAELLKTLLPSQAEPEKREVEQAEQVEPIERHKVVPPTPVPRPLPVEERLPPLPVKPARPAIPFHRLAELNNSLLETIIRTVDPAIVRLALAGADEALVSRVVGLLPKKVAQQFRRQLHQLGPTRLSDVAFAQNSLAEAASELLQQAQMQRGSQAHSRTAVTEQTTFA